MVTHLLETHQNVYKKCLSPKNEASNDIFNTYSLYKSICLLLAIELCAHSQGCLEININE